MKIKSIAAICKKSKVIHLYTKREEYSVMKYIRFLPYRCASRFQNLKSHPLYGV